MPNLDFYAMDDDWAAVLATVFNLELFRVFESDSEPERELREFRATVEVPTDPRRLGLALFVLGSGPEPVQRRIDFLPGVSTRGAFRYSCEGWA